MHYRIRVRGELDSSWQSWFEALQIKHGPDGTTILAGQLPDQAALHGMLLKIVRLGLTLLELQVSETRHSLQATYIGHKAGDRAGDKAGDRAMIGTTEVNAESETPPNYDAKAGYASANGVRIYYKAKHLFDGDALSGSSKWKERMLLPVMTSNKLPDLPDCASFLPRQARTIVPSKPTASGPSGIGKRLNSSGEPSIYSLFLI